MRREIGSEFYDIPLQEQDNMIFPEDTKWLISGTAALEAILLDILSFSKIASVAIPSWCCSCLIEPFLKHNIRVTFYPVSVDKGHFAVDTTNIDTDIMLVMDFFGYEAGSINPNGYDGIIIRDITHSVFCPPKTDAHYYFGSLRKWAGFWTGGFAWAPEWHTCIQMSSQNDEYVHLRSSAMEAKKYYLAEIIDKKDYLLTFERCEDYLESCPIQAGSIRDVKCARKLDADFIKEKRRNNARFLLSHLSEGPIFRTVNDNDVPLFVPIIVNGKKRDALKRFFIENDIYCPSHWAITNSHILSTEMRYVYENEISLVCDQRYSEKDMQRIIDTYNVFLDKY